MIQVSITNLQTGQIGWGAKFPDQPSADAWIAQGQDGGWWGKSAGQYSQSQLSAFEMSTQTAVQTADPVTGAMLTDPLVTIPAQYTIAQVDTTAADAQAAALATAQAYLASTDWYVIRQADNGTAMPADIKAAREQARLVINPATTAS